MLSSNLYDFSIISVLLPKAIICELLFKMSVIANTNKFKLSFSISLLIASSNFSFLFNTSSMLTVFTCAITHLTPFSSNFFASKFINSSSEKSSKSDPAYNITIPYESKTI